VLFRKHSKGVTKAISNHIFPGKVHLQQVPGAVVF